MVRKQLSEGEFVSASAEKSMFHVKSVFAVFLMRTQALQA
jgi:hypothetical protein